MAALAMGASVVAFSAPASAATPPPCSTVTEMSRHGNVIAVPTAKGSTHCYIGRDFAANRTVVSHFQLTMRRCYPNLAMASPYSDEKVGGLDADGYFGPRSIAALKAVQRHVGASADGIYGPETRDRMLFMTPNRERCHAYSLRRP